MRSLAAVAFAVVLWLGGVAVNHARLASGFTRDLSTVAGDEQARVVEHGIWLLSSSVYYGLGALLAAVVGVVLLVLQGQPGAGVRALWAHGARDT